MSLCSNGPEQQRVILPSILGETRDGGSASRRIPPVPCVPWEGEEKDGVNERLDRGSTCVRFGVTLRTRVVATCSNRRLLLLLLLLVVSACVVSEKTRLKPPPLPRTV